MSVTNNITLIGRIARNVTIKNIETAKGTMSITENALAVNKRAKNGQKEAMFINFNLFGKTAENFVRFCRKGNRIAINGELQIDNVQGENGYKTYVKINANSFESFDFNDDNEINATFDPNANDVLNDENNSFVPDEDLPF